MSDSARYFGRPLTRRAVTTAGVIFAVQASRASLALAQSPQATPTSSWTFTDDRGIAVSLPERPDRVIAQISAAAALWDYGVRPTAVFGPQYLEDGSRDSRIGGVDLAAVADLRDAIATKPGLRVMLAAGDADSFYVGHPDFMAEFWAFRDLGMDIVANEVNDFWQTLSWEEVHKYPADLILIDVRDGTYGLDEFAGVATWASVPAARADQVAAWNLEPVYSHVSFTKKLRMLRELVRNAHADLV